MEWVLPAVPTVTSVVGVRTWVLAVLTSQGQIPILNKPNKNTIVKRKKNKIYSLWLLRGEEQKGPVACPWESIFGGFT